MHQPHILTQYQILLFHSRLNWKRMFILFTVIPSNLRNSRFISPHRGERLDIILFESQQYYICFPNCWLYSSFFSGLRVLVSSMNMKWNGGPISFENKISYLFIWGIVECGMRNRRPRQLNLREFTSIQTHLVGNGKLKRNNDIPSSSKILIYMLFVNWL